MDKKQQKVKRERAESSDNEDGVLSDEEIVNVEFDFFTLEESDYHSIKNMLADCFAEDAEMLDLSGLSDFILTQRETVGTTVKADGIESDPYAFISCIGLTGDEWKENPLSMSLLSYLLSKPDSVSLQKLVSSNQKIALVFHERLINMPWQVSAPLFNCLQQELVKAAQQGSKRFEFDYFIIISPTYQEVASSISENNEKGQGPSENKKLRANHSTIGTKKKAKAKKQEYATLFSYVHLEDEYIAKHMQCTFNMAIKVKQGDNVIKQAAFHEFGMVPARSVMILPMLSLPVIVKELQLLVENSSNLISQDTI